jgi:hypothetical protein
VNGVPSEPVSRALARDDLLTLAQDAERAIGIVRARDSIGRDRVERLARNEQDLFTLAVERQLAAAGKERVASTRGQALYHAGVIVRFCRVVGITLGVEADPRQLFEQAVRLLEEDADAETGVRNRNLDVKLTFRRARDLRLNERFEEAFDTADVPDGRLHGAGADGYRARLHFEVAAAMLCLGQAGQVEAALGEAEHDYYAGDAGQLASRHRFEFGRGLAAWEAGETSAATGLFRAAQAYLGRTPGPERRHDVARLSLTLAAAEQLAAAEPAATAATIREVVGLAREAVEVAERIRTRWNVVARSRSPLSVVFHRVYGDIALLLAPLAGQEAAELGLRVALAAKQSGFASRMRTGRSLINPRVRGVIKDIVDAENLDESHATTDVQQSLAELRDELRRSVSPMLADTLLPAPRDVADLVSVIGPRYALDVVSLPDSLARSPNWFRTLIRPDGTVEFERFIPGPHLAEFFEGRDGKPAWLDRLGQAIRGRGPDWHGLAAEVLPAALLRDLADRTDDEPLELIVSAHAALSLLPWAALDVDGRGTRLVQRAVVAQTPVLTCLSDVDIFGVAGPALVRLVARDEGGVDVEAERAAWGLPLRAGRVPLSGCGFAADARPADVPGRLATALEDDRRPWGFAHVAAHGDGSDLDQHLLLPERLSAGAALGLYWPQAVLMASCHVGRLVNVAEAEPLNFVMALLTGGSRYVVAALNAVEEEATGELAADLVRQVRCGEPRLDVALRRAQLPLVGLPVVFWALFAAYVR